MGTARTIAIKSYLKRHGIKICWVANSIGIESDLLRYHINAGMNDEILIQKIKSLMRAHATALIQDLEEIPDATKPGRY